ncbi:MAG: S8 family serine peptidase, partial [Stenotrophomonas sp.]|nr:S8 family serine peptidase [Stenotrophomonas sp.]
MNKPLSFRACAVAVGIVLGTFALPGMAADLAPGSRVVPLQHVPDASASAGTSRFIVKYKPGSAPARDRSRVASSLTSAAARGIGTQGLAGLALRPLRRSATGADIISTSRELDARQAQALLQQLRADPDVLYAQRDTRKYALDFTPNDPELPIYQWDLLNTAGGIHGPVAWEHSTGEGVVVAVLDTGSTPHADLKDNLIPGYDFVSWYGQSLDEPDVAGDGDGRDPDATDPGDWTDASMASWCGGSSSSSWHGTHVAGTVAAITNNGLGVAGTAWGAKVQPVRVLGHCGGLTSDIADAIVWAAGGHVDGVPDNPTPADVINMSLGGSGSCAGDPATQEAIDLAVSRGTTVVVAAGNQGADAANYSPASCRNVVTVGAAGIGGRMASYTNFGTTVALSAPGGDPDSGAGISRGYV